MALQFATQQDLINDLSAKAGIYDVYTIVSSDESLADLQTPDGIIRHDLAVAKLLIDQDGTERLTVAIQQIIEELGSDTWGYGANRQWDLQDRSELSFTDRLNQRADQLEANNANILKIGILSADNERENGIVEVYQDADPVTKQRHFVWWDGSQIQNRQITTA